MNTPLIDHLAELTGQRDRDLLDVALANAVADLLRPRSVAIARVVGDARGQGWTTRARVRPGDATATADPAWASLQDLPALSERPLRCAALKGQVVTSHEPGASVSIFPLVTEGETSGVVEIVTDAPLDDGATSLVSGILRIFRNFQNLLDDSERDMLTGLRNRKTFDDTFYKALQNTPAGGPDTIGPRRRADAGGHWWIAMVDIDFFKAVNDTYGHLIGDEVLLLLGQLMGDTLRFQDRLFRFGGEEFVIVMPCDAEHNASLALERVRRRAETHSFPRVGRLTVSIGFTCIVAGDSPGTALERADRAVYHAKAHGRNQVCSHADLVVRGRLQASESVGEIELF